jgi:hypothetical protein
MIAKIAIIGRRTLDAAMVAQEILAIMAISLA